MNLLVIGASRGIGLRLVVQALGGGHRVTAFARHPEAIVAVHERLKKVRGNVLDPEALRAALDGQDAVVVVLGKKTPWDAPPDLFSRGTQMVLDAMALAGVTRLVCVTGIGAGDTRGHGGLLYDGLMLPLLLSKMYADKDRQEALVRASSIDWTLVRPGFLTDGPLTGDYRALTDLKGVKAGSIARADVAHFILDALEHHRWIGEAPLLTR